MRTCTSHLVVTGVVWLWLAPGAGRAEPVAPATPKNTPVRPIPLRPPLPAPPSAQPVPPLPVPQVDCKARHFSWVQPLKYSSLPPVGQSSSAAALADSMGNCPVAGCGLNGAWLGSGVQFRTLHTTAGAPNPQGLRIREFRKGLDVLRLQVSGQDLQGIKRDSSEVLDGEALIGAQLMLEQVDAVGRVVMGYQLTIADSVVAGRTVRGVRDEEFWTTCIDPAHCTGAPKYARLYSFTVRASDGCEVRLCRPGLSDTYQGNLDGTAVIFRGDYYDERSHKVFATPQNTYDEDVFNIACVGTAISKLHMLRHTAASDPARPTLRDPAPPSTPEQRTTMLRLLTADYCGSGGTFTEDGLPIWLDFDSRRWKPSLDSRYTPGATATIDARWNADGASCLLVPRLRTTERSRVDAACARVGRPALPTCTAPLDTSRASLSGNYAISWTPPSR